MDNEIQYFEDIKNVSDFISVLQEELPGLGLPEERLKEIEKYLDGNNRDYHSLQAIIDILISIPDNENSTILRHQLHF